MSEDNLEDNKRLQQKFEIMGALYSQTQAGIYFLLR